MTDAVLYGYLIGCVVTSIGVALTTRHQSRQISVVAAGAAWPLLFLGAVQFAAVALVAEVARIRESRPKSVDDELEELLTEWAIGHAATHDRRLPVATGGDNDHESATDAYRQTAGRQ